MSAVKIFFCGMLFISFNSLAGGGTWLDATRIIYNEKDTSRSVKISSTSSDIPYLVRAWVTHIDNMTVADKWAVTPPVYRLNENGAVQLRLYLLDKSGLPGDRESVFYLNVLSIPGTSSEESKMENDSLGGKIIIAINSKIKVFYRPGNLADTDMEAEYKKLQFRAEGRSISIINPTPFYMNFNEIKVDGVKYNINRQMVSPFGNVTFTTKSVPQKINYRLINDFGGITPLVSVSLKG
ncbi:molecular chaperone [Salmonella enterica]|uniref:Molecular chaperone n=1 Tax=Salmonella diarizonae TaxID=59204 RepID=A0A702D8V6_SALDZ|nr:molecular chaperone [Salmonella enterica]ECE6696413.1 molecular chaperone [Salmonella enterica subsp. diarizonae]EHG6070515.1 molecular chaperone [Salmonella enterica subsp. diarizonae serovar 61:z52:z53]EKO1001501.1 molecular chaperone [Salmonella enterica subsp. enterica]EKR1798098.1 molecular chaperone [Salmonella enterica subsp. diarizonae serovar 65:z10:e,n,x,z15]ASG86033.1 hypothetical protein LFZ55_24695 [Salmonella enterica subsp. diarizonae serovar 65:c:z str. SA20044251]